MLRYLGFERLFLRSYSFQHNATTHSYIKNSIFVLKIVNGSMPTASRASFFIVREIAESQQYQAVFSY
jgi:hypothetical protein